MVSVRGVAPVANNLESADHLADGEETNDLGGDDADLPDGGGVLGPYASEERLRVVGGRGAVEESRRVLEALGERLDVALDGLDSTLGRCQFRWRSLRADMPSRMEQLTGEPCCGPGR